VRLWHAGLDADGFQAMLGTMQLIAEPYGISYGSIGTQTQAAHDIALCRLVDDASMEHRLRYGTAITDNYTYLNDSWFDNTASAIISIIIGQGNHFSLTPEDPPAETPAEKIAFIARLIFCSLRSSMSDPACDPALVRLLFSLPNLSHFDPIALASAVLSHPELPAEIPELGNSEMFGRYAGVVNRVRSYVLPQDIDLKDPTNETTVAVRGILKRTERRPDEPRMCG
jgi:hypothetical protein